MGFRRTCFTGGGFSGRCSVLGIFNLVMDEGIMSRNQDCGKHRRDKNYTGTNMAVGLNSYRFIGWITDVYGDRLMHISIPDDECSRKKEFSLQLSDHPEWIDCAIELNWIPSLVDILRDMGRLPKLIEPESRTEDLKIIHRLIDKLPGGHE